MPYFTRIFREVNSHPKMANIFTHPDECVTMGRKEMQAVDSDFPVEPPATLLTSLRYSFSMRNVDPKPESITESCKQEVSKNTLEARQLV